MNTNQPVKEYPKSKMVYWIRPKKRKPARVHPFMTFDCETWPTAAGHELAGKFCLGVVYWKKGEQDVCKVFTDRDEMVSYMLSRTTPKRVFGWNIRYDGFYLLSSINASGDLQSTVMRIRKGKVVRVLDNGRVIRTKDKLIELPKANLIKHQGRWLMLQINQNEGDKEHLKAVDACNSFGVGRLEDAMTAFELPYSKIPVDWANIFPGSPDMLTLQARCVADAMSTYELMEWYENFWVSRGVKPGLTRYSTSLEFLKSLCLEPDDVLPALPKCFKDLVRPALRGARCHVFKRHQVGDVYYYDINRLYPSMYRKPLPLSGAYYADVKPEEVEHLSEFGFVSCTVWIPEQRFGPLPYVGEGGKLEFPVGKVVKFTWWTLELQQAIAEFGCEVLAVSEAILFEQSDTFLAKFADETEALKKAVQNKGQLTLIKHVANGLWGKFAEKDEQEHVHFDAIPDDYPLDKIREISEGEGDNDIPFWVTVTNIPKGHHLPHIAAAVTAYGRMRLVHDMNWLMKQDPEREIFYCDTDSIFTNKPLPPEWVGVNDGQYKLEHFTDEEGIWLDQKIYAVDGLKPRAKSFPGTPDMDTYRKALAGDVKGFKVHYLQQVVDYREGTIRLIPRERQLHVPNGERRGVSIAPSRMVD